jgi:integrase
MFTREELGSVLKASRGSRWEAAFWVLATTGMRVSEVLGLTWKDIDLDTGRIRIEQQTGRIYGEPGVRLLPLKTRASKREVIVPPMACDVLRWHADKQRMERRQAEITGEGEDHGTVFATPTGKLYFRSQPEAVFRQIVEDLGIEGTTLHTFRHTVVTLVQEAGHTLKDAQTLVGHATERMTASVYSHPTAAGMQRIADGMQQMLSGLTLTAPGDALTPDEAPWNTLMGQPMGRAVAETA